MLNNQSSIVVRLLRPLSSLTLTVVLLLMAMVLIFAGTTVQTEMGIWDVQNRFFHSWFTVIPWRLFFPLWDWGSTRMPGIMPFPGGYTLIFLLLANLLAAHGLRFKVNWKRSGILLIHAGMILLLVGEVITAEKAVESQMPIDNGASANYSQDIREPELAITDRSNPDRDTEVVVPLGVLKRQDTVQNPAIPFSVKIERFFPNSDIAGPRQTNVTAEALATAGVGKELCAFGVDPVKGTDSSTNAPSAYVTLTKSGGETLGTYLVSTIVMFPQFPQIQNPQVVNVDGKEYWVQLRFKRDYKPYTMHLIKFSHDRYTGTDQPKNYSSLVRLVDPTRNVDREVLIWMNHPLRYNGETFYQASFKKGDLGTVLQVVRNPGWLLPYISCTMVGLGMLIHFGMHLLGFLSKRLSSEASGALVVAADRPLGSSEPDRAAPSRQNGNGNGKGNGKHHAGAAVLERTKVVKRSTSIREAPRTNLRGVWIPAAVVTAIFTIYLLGLLAPAKSEGPYDLDAFARVPVTYEGRTMPLDSLARNTLRILSGKSQISLDNGEKVPAIKWLLNVFADPETAENQKVFRITHPEVISLLGLNESFQKASTFKKLMGMAERERYSPSDLYAGFKKFKEQYDQAMQVDGKKRDLFQRQVVELGSQMALYQNIGNMAPLYLSPPLQKSEWRTLGVAANAMKEKNERDPGAESFLGMIGARHDNQPQEFGTIAREYRTLIENRMPDLATKLDLEVRFNQADPFIQCMALYVIVFLLAAGSWLVWRPALSRAALAMLVLALVWHSMALITRMYLHGRPPVTNLYSSAIFIAWAAVLFCVVMEFIYRNAVSSAAAAAMAFPSLLIAHYLAASGDTMKMLEAVLDTNLWLATHVVVVTLGYSATFLAGFIAIGYVLGGVFSSALGAEARKTLYRMVYGVVCFAMIASFIGTILGGIWADQSWGRFWGWDPKENGAVLIVLWNAIILHARWGGLVRERGFMLMAIAGNIMTSWSWFGTNMLGVGLHSYGFMDSALFWLLSWVGMNLLIIGIGLMPTHIWRSFRSASDPRLEPA